MGPHFSQVGGVGLIPDRRTKIPLAMWCGQKKGGGDRDGSLRQRLEGRRHKLRDTRGPQRLQEAGKALRRARGPVSPDHTLISGCQDRANECWSKSARVQSPAAQPRPLTQGVSGRGPRAPHSICTDLCAVRGPPWVPRGSLGAPRSPQACGTAGTLLGGRLPRGAALRCPVRSRLGAAPITGGLHVSPASVAQP